MFIVFFILAAGYLLGRVSVKGIALGTAGVLMFSLGFGILASYVPFFTIAGNHIVLYLHSAITLDDGTALASSRGVFSLVSSLGTSMFLTAVGLTAGPKFFRTFNRKSIGYLVMSFVVIALGTIATIAVILFSPSYEITPSLAVGLMTGALTSTPGLTAALEVAPSEAEVLAGYGISYLFGVLGVVLFVQIVPKVMKLDIAKERERFVAASAIEISDLSRKLISIDSHSFFPFVMAVALGHMLGSVSIPGLNFSLGAAGGMLISGLVIGHFRHVGPIDCRFDKNTLQFFQELGLCLFLVGAGVPGGVGFMSHVQLSHFIYGAIITLLPMSAGFIFGKYVFGMCTFNSLGAVTGGMTSTPALSALITVSGTEEVTNAYAATYPLALLCVVLASRAILSIM